MSTDWLGTWCGASGLEPRCDGWALNPCWLESISALLAALAFLTTLFINRKRLKLAQAHKRARTKESGPVGISGGELGMIAGAFFVASIHAMHLAAILLYKSWSQAPYHLTYHALMFITWMGIEIASVYVSKVHVVLDLRLPLFCLVIIYIVSLETYWSLYRVATVFSLPYQRASIWSLMLQTVVSILLTVLDWKRRSKAAAAAAAPPGYQPIPPTAPSGPDVEVGVGKGGGLTAPAAAVLTSAPSGPLRLDPDQRLSWLTVFWESCIAVWPETRWLKFRALLAFGLLLLMRVLNLVVPILYKNLVDGLASAGASTDKGDEPSAHLWLIWGWLSPWILAYLIAIFFQGGVGGGMTGAINNLRQFLWIPVGQDSFRRISLRIFSHVLGLDLAFHLARKTGEVTKQIDRGTNAMQNILSTVLFSIVPTCIDVLTASTYLAQALEPSVALTVFLTVGSYIPVTILITEWRGSLRREMNITEQIQSARITDALLNYETVHYFTNEPHEREQYAKAIDDFQRAEYKSTASISLLNTVQSLIMWVGISIGLLVCSAGVHKGELTVGDVVLFLSLMAQLYGPLNWFGMFYRTIQQYTIDMENLFQLLDKQSQVNDAPEAKTLVVTDAKVDYDSVWFQYESRNAVLKGVTFTVPGGQTIAFVGATGSGKSTLTRLIVRFYDVTSGAVRIDGIDVRHVTLQSLRAAIGVVPQDTVLFNDTILTNIRYGRLTATDEEVVAAAEAACIHEAITTRFPKGYQTVVGERGLRLSGGEKQRVAFARALLKNPQILVLDEATSALDTLTERRIQAALVASRAHRTTLIVAHRLSTIVDADTIVVLHLGEVKEVGSHPELLSKGGMYAELWHKQAKSAAGDHPLNQHLGDAGGSQTGLSRATGDNTAASSTHGSSTSLVTLGEGAEGQGKSTDIKSSQQRQRRGWFGRRQ